MDPCGAVCDWGRVPYSTLVKPFKDSDETAMIDWRPAAKGARVLPYFSIFMNREWDRDKWELRSKGEVVGAPRKANKRLAIPGLLGEHPCGKEEWYREGMPFDPDAPDCHRDRDGLPECCAPPKQITGAILGGKSGVSYTPPVDAVMGGIEVGGESGDSAEYTDATYGGIEVGGESGDSAEYTDATYGGIEVGGEAGDDYTTPTDPTEGGIQVGGESGDYREGTDPTEGGIEVGGESGDYREGTDATAGGLLVGGSSGDAYEGTDATEGGVEVGGEAGDTFIPCEPTILSKSVASNGTTLTITWNRAVDFASGMITIGGSQSSTANYTSGTGTTSLVFTIATTILMGETVTADIPADLATAAGYSCGNAAVSGASVFNGSTQTGGPTPGVSCSTAGTMTIGSPAPATVPAGTTRWFKCPQPASGAFHVDYVVSGFGAMMTIYQAADCSTLGFGTPVMGTGCTGFTVSPGMTMFFEMDNDLGGAASSYTITVATGTC